jgi:hypothetical protein
VNIGLQLSFPCFVRDMFQDVLLKSKVSH